MEVDEWLSELIYLWKNGVTKGVAHASHLSWVETIQSLAGDYNSSFVDEKKVNKLLNFALPLLKAANSTKHKSKLSSMVSMMLILYANELKGRYGNLIPETYVQKFFEVYDKYSDTSGVIMDILWGLSKNCLVERTKMQYQLFLLFLITN